MTSKLDLDILVGRAKEGSISKPQIDLVATSLNAGMKGSDAYKALYVLGRSDAFQYEGLVARHLYNSADPMLSRLALQILCTFWGRTAKYVEHVRRFVDGEPWDSMGDVRQVAITAAGEWLSLNVDCRMLSSLISLAQSTDELEDVERRLAVEALARAVGVPVGEALNPGVGDGGWESWADGIKMRAAKRYATEC